MYYMNEHPCLASLAHQGYIYHISAWAINNNLKLNVNKSRELIIHGRARFDPPPPIPGVSRVEVLPVLGVVLSGDLSVGHHLTETLGSCSRSLYAVRILKAHGLT